jgi:hypothetical protein
MLKKNPIFIFNTVTIFVFFFFWKQSGQFIFYEPSSRSRQFMQYRSATIEMLDRSRFLNFFHLAIRSRKMCHSHKSCQFSYFFLLRIWPHYPDSYESSQQLTDTKKFLRILLSSSLSSTFPPQYSQIFFNILENIECQFLLAEHLTRHRKLSKNVIVSSDNTPTLVRSFRHIAALKLN